MEFIPFLQIAKIPYLLLNNSQLQIVTCEGYNNHFHYKMKIALAIIDIRRHLIFIHGQLHNDFLDGPFQNIFLR